MNKYQGLTEADIDALADLELQDPVVDESLDSEKTRIKITRARCMCSGCQEQGIIEFEDSPHWCQAFEVVGSYELWETVVKAIKADSKYEIVSDDSGIKESRSKAIEDFIKELRKEFNDLPVHSWTAGDLMQKAEKLKDKI